MSKRVKEELMTVQSESVMARFEPLYFIGGGKGGVGKSLAAQALLHYLSGLGKALHLVESDTSNPDVAKAHQGAASESAVPIALLDLDIEDGWLELLNLRAEHPGRAVVLNTGARNNLAVSRFGGMLAAGLEELGAPLITVWMIDGTRDCLELLAQHRQVFSSSPLCVLRNAHLARSFDLYDGSNVRRELEAAGGRSLTFPALADRVTQTMSGKRLSLQAAMKSDALPFGHKIALRQWLAAAGQLFDQVCAADVCALSKEPV